ncbi:hypothetical protein BASA62_010101 [Batrachochytrium salamandrivorans]|nr:hypothetical protein BASA62_010101 [Batrachochytrium salamandrivorans]
MGKAYYGLELVGGNKSHLAPLQTTINKGIRLFTGARLSTAIRPLLVETGIGSLLTRSLVSRARLLERSVTKRTPINFICSSTDNDVFTLNVQGQLVRSQRWFWSRRDQTAIQEQILADTTAQISTNQSQTHHPYTPSIHTNITSTFTTIPITPTISEIRHQRSKYAFERTFQVWGKSKLACSYVQANHASSAKFLRSPALSTGQAIGASLLSLARCGGLWDYPRALKAGLLHPTATDPNQLSSPSLCILCHSHLDCRPMAHLVVDCTHPTVFFARVDTQLLQAINDTRVQISDCTLHTTTTTTTTTTTPASPSLSTTSINSNPDSTGTSAIWDNTRFEPPISVAQQKFPGRPRTQWKKTPTGSRTTTTDTHTAAISSTPTPTHISYIGSDDILTVLLGGSLPGTNTAGNTEACPGQQWLTGTVEEGNLLSSNQPVAHRMCDFLQISVRVYRAMLWKHHKSNLSHIPDI